MTLPNSKDVLQLSTFVLLSIGYKKQQTLDTYIASSETLCSVDW